MLSKLLESLSAAFLLTAASYAAGVVQTKGLFRELGVQPELVSIDVQKALYDGGVIVFYHSTIALLILSIAIIIFAATTATLYKLEKTSEAAKKVYEKYEILENSKAALYIAFLGSIFFIATYSFGKAESTGEKLAQHLKESCTEIKLSTDKVSEESYCSIVKTQNFIWVYDKKNDKMIAFKTDDIKSMISE